MNSTLKWCRQSLKFLWLLAHSSKQHAKLTYEIFSNQNHLGESSLYLNLGYWEQATTYDAACQAMAKLLGEASCMGPQDEVLDVGFGFADQDLFWIDTFSPKRISGLNIAPSQVDFARKRVAERHLEGRIDLRVGSAIQIPFEAEKFDKVVALETAFHFPTREHFFQEAYRVLRPKGRLAITDILFLTKQRAPGSKKSMYGAMKTYLLRTLWQVPLENMYPSDVYMEKLLSAGFENIQIRSIREHVIKPFAVYANNRLKEPAVMERIHPLVRLMWRAVNGPGLDYILVTADKPTCSSKSAQ